MFKQIFIALMITMFEISSANAQSFTLDQLVTNATNQAIKNNNLPGIAVDVYYQGKPHIYNFGVSNLSTKEPVTDNTIFELASISKLFTATLAAIQIESGHMNLNSSISQYFPQLKQTSNASVNQITIEDLATHTSSLPRMSNQLPGLKGSNPQTKTAAQMILALQQWSPSFPVGSKFQYSNLGFGLLGAAVENASHKSFSQLLQNQITEPLGMSQTISYLPTNKENYAQGYTPDNTPAPFYPSVSTSGGGGVRSTPADMMKFMEANLNVLPNIPANLQKAIAMTQKPYFKVKPNFVMGLGWQRITKDNQLYLTKNGMNAGFNSFIGLSPSKNIGVVVLVNKRGTHAAEKLGRFILFKLTQS